MAKARYRIDEIRIEGFRGFTEPQVIRCNGKHLFVFGPNGRGKSSIVEAIRWCLFGSQSGKEIEVGNTLYQKGDCVVSLRLSGVSGHLELKRELRPGSNSSRTSVLDSAGKETIITNALPQLARIGQEQGTQVIFAAQQSLGRHAQVDVTDFTKVLCVYLHIEDVPKLRDDLRRVLEERADQANGLALQLETAEHTLRDSMHVVQTKLNELRNNPPWGGGATPTGKQTQARIAALLREHARRRGCRAPRLLGKEAIDHIHTWIDESKAESAESLEARRTKLTEQLTQAGQEREEVRKTVEQAASLRAGHGDTLARRAELLGGRDVEAIRSDLERIERSLSRREKRAMILRQGGMLCEEDSPEACPLCNSPFNAMDLRTVIAAQIGDLDGSTDTATISGLQSTLGEIARIDQFLEKQASLLADAKPAEDAARAALFKTLKLRASATETDVERRVGKIRQAVESLDREIDTADDERGRWAASVRNLESELRYHQYRDELASLQRVLDSGLQPARDILVAYRDLLDSGNTISELVGVAFNEAIDRASPPLEAMLTDVFIRLTGQLSFDRIRIWRNPDSPERRELTRELRVASSKLDGLTFPRNVLNGQAAKALQLVPYFVFSRFQPEDMELDLLLIDDPSESFDTSHVGSLVAELAEAASHAQLIVATHEADKFESHIKRCFSKEPYLTVAVVDFDPLKGPTIDQG